MDLPKRVGQLLWEYDLNALPTGAELPDVVVERVMVRGGWEEMRWLLASCDRERLRRFLELRGSRVLEPRELAFWAFACAVPDERVETWIRDARERLKAWRG